MKEYNGIVLKGGQCPTCQSRYYTPTDRVVKQAAGYAKCNSCGREVIIVNAFFELLANLNRAMTAPAFIGKRERV